MPGRASPAAIRTFSAFVVKLGLSGSLAGGEATREAPEGREFGLSRNMPRTDTEDPKTEGAAVLFVIVTGGFPWIMAGKKDFLKAKKPNIKSAAPPTRPYFKKLGIGIFRFVFVSRDER